MKKQKKRGNPDYISSCFYIHQDLNCRFDQARLQLKREGYREYLERSDIVQGLIEEWLVHPRPIKPTTIENP